MIVKGVKVFSNFQPGKSYFRARFLQCQAGRSLIFWEAGPNRTKATKATPCSCLSVFSAHGWMVAMKIRERRRTRKLLPLPSISELVTRFARRRERNVCRLPSFLSNGPSAPGWLHGKVRVDLFDACLCLPRQIHILQLAILPRQKMLL